MVLNTGRYYIIYTWNEKKQRIWYRPRPGESLDPFDYKKFELFFNKNVFINVFICVFICIRHIIQSSFCIISYIKKI